MKYELSACASGERPTEVDVGRVLAAKQGVDARRCHSPGDETGTEVDGAYRVEPTRLGNEAQCGSQNRTSSSVAGGPHSRAPPKGHLPAGDTARATCRCSARPERLQHEARTAPKLCCSTAKAGKGALRYVEDVLAPDRLRATIWSQSDPLDMRRGGQNSSTDEGVSHVMKQVHCRSAPLSQTLAVTYSAC